MALDSTIIMKYTVPEVAEYTIDESLVCYIDNKKFAQADSIDNAKDRIRSSVDEQRKIKIQKLNTSLSTLNSINVGLIDEKYRIKAFN